MTISNHPLLRALSVQVERVPHILAGLQRASSADPLCSRDGLRSA